MNGAGATAMIIALVAVFAILLFALWCVNKWQEVAETRKARSNGLSRESKQAGRAKPARRHLEYRAMQGQRKMNAGKWYRTMDRLNQEKRSLEHKATSAFLALRHELTPVQRTSALRCQTECATRIAEINSQIVALMAEDSAQYAQAGVR